LGTVGGRVKKSFLLLKKTHRRRVLEEITVWCEPREKGTNSVKKKGKKPLHMGKWKGQETKMATTIQKMSSRMGRLLSLQGG